MIDVLTKENLDLKDLQLFHRELDREKKFDQDIFRNIAYLSGEIGELVSAIRKLRKVKDLSEEPQSRKQIGDELADCLAYVIKLANYAKIDLEDAYRNKMKQNLTREWPPKIR